LFAPGRLKEIEAELPRLEALVERMGSPEPIQVLVKYVNAVLIGHKGDWDADIAISWECLQAYREQKNQESLINMLDELSWAILEKNRWGEFADLDQVDKLLEEALAFVEQENSNERIWVYPRMSLLRARQGRVVEARQWLEKTHQEMSAKPTAWEDRIIGECETEIAIAMRDWDTAILANERVARFEQRLGFKVGAARSLLCWADLCIRRSNALDLENAQTLLREAITEFTEMGIGHYPDIAQEKLKEIQTMLRTQTIENEQMTKELRKARHVQESLLPEFLPELPGWDLAVLLEPAHETSGDFYDYLTLPDGNLGLVIADVTDKGTSAALFMALSRSLWRTFAMEHPTEPERTLADTNRRIVSDTHGGLFITLLYGILNPQNGEFSYCSAGHHPAFLLRANGDNVETLGSTGFPLGIMDETSWSRANVKIEVGDALVLYTDGLTDAQNTAEEFFGFERLQEAIQKQHGETARELRDSLREEIRKWVGAAPQYDDITLMVVMRK
jgi:serine phosphatase RsbU (regulator of sigma subunit)